MPHDSYSFAQLQSNQYFWLQLTQIPGLGPVSLKKLWQALGSADAIVSAPASQLQQLGLRRSFIHAIHCAQSRANSDDRLRLIDDWLACPQHHLLTLDDPAYPVLLQQIADPPPLLYLVGDPELLGLPQIALVGSRNATAQGLENSRAYGRYLSESGLIPVSGLALGIDAAAHRGALQGLGLTVAVLGTGVDQVYPASHQELARQIVEQGGALLSELPLATPPRAQQFPKRNRIISGLSLGVLVVEAALRSGSLITARQAMEQGREVFALPGSVHNPLSKGCHRLIRQGALLVDSAQQILQELAPQLSERSVPMPSTIDSDTITTVASQEAGLPQAEQQLLQVLGFDPVALDQLVHRCGLPVAQLQGYILSLELQGLIESVAGGYQRVVR